MPANIILIISPDPYLAGLYGRKFETHGWNVVICENIKNGEIEIVKQKPDIVLLQKDCSYNIIDEVKKIKTLISTKKPKIVIIASETDMQEIAEARNIGADDYLLSGHFVANEAVEKMKDLIRNQNKYV
jgi:DNA-binding response OmpR family regulator